MPRNRLVPPRPPSSEQVAGFVRGAESVKSLSLDSPLPDADIAELSSVILAEIPHIADLGSASADWHRVADRMDGIVRGSDVHTQSSPPGGRAVSR